MRIALVHGFYRSSEPSGENVAVLDQAEALSRAGHDVSLVERRTDDELRRPAYSLRAGWRVATGTGHDPIDELRDIAPDVVHVHNLFPNLGTRWLARWRGPVVATLHNFRSVCASYALERDGRECTLCPDRGSHNAVRHACYRGSRLATVPLAIRTSGGIAADPVLRRADRLIVLGERPRAMFERLGADPARLRVVRNGVPELPRQAEPATDRWILHGRMSREKGIDRLAAIWPGNEGLDLVGGGTEPPALPPQVAWRGAVDAGALRARLAGYAGGVFAGRAAEDVPISVAECLSAGLPVIAREGTAAADFVVAQGCGTAYADAASLAAALHDARARRGELSRAAIAAHAAHFGMGRWVAQLVSVYDEAIAAPGYPG